MAFPNKDEINITSSILLSNKFYFSSMNYTFLYRAKFDDSKYYFMEEQPKYSWSIDIFDEWEGTSDNQYVLYPYQLSNYPCPNLFGSVYVTPRQIAVVGTFQAPRTRSNRTCLKI